MGITRRDFLVCAAAAAVRPRLDPWRPGRLPKPHAAGPIPVLLDMRRHGLRESLAGYESTLLSLGMPVQRVGPDAASRCHTLIVPAALQLPPPALHAIVANLDAGAMVLLESGAGFGTAGGFDVHRAALRDWLQVDIEPPVGLWEAGPGPGPVPYVHYTWPRPALVRDFSRVVPVKARAGECIARVDGLAVALRRRRGRGTLIFLGSPLGPALWAGDVQARHWLLGVLAGSTGGSHPA